MRRLLVAAVAAVALAALAGCSSSSDGSPDRLRLDPSTTTTTPATTVALADRLPTTVLDGFTPSGEPESLDLEGAAGSSTDVAGERASLEAHGFARGVVHAWSAGVDSVYVALYEFGDAAGAAGYAADQAAAIRAHGATPFPGGFTTVEHQGTLTLTTHAAVRQEGRWWALVLLASQAGDRTPAEATAIAASIRLGP